MSKIDSYVMFNTILDAIIESHRCEISHITGEIHKIDDANSIYEHIKYAQEGDMIIVGQTPYKKTSCQHYAMWEKGN